MLPKVLLAITFGAILTPAVGAQTVDLVCEGDTKIEILVIGRGYLTQPSSFKETRNYHFLDGRLMKSERYPDQKVFDDRSCAWSQGDVKCNLDSVIKVCSDARARGVVEPEISFCRNSLEINRYNGTTTEIEASFRNSFADQGRTIITNTFKGKCEFAPRRRF